jgi:hypothetical protein
LREEVSGTASRRLARVRIDVFTRECTPMGSVNSGTVTVDVRYWEDARRSRPTHVCWLPPPAEIIGPAAWRYCRFALSYRDVEELLAERGVMVTHESIRQWCQKFGQQYANTLRRRRPQRGDKWHLDEVFIRIDGVIRAVRPPLAARTPRVILSSLAAGNARRRPVAPPRPRRGRGSSHRA